MYIYYRYRKKFVLLFAFGNYVLPYGQTNANTAGCSMTGCADDTRTPRAKTQVYNRRRTFGALTGLEKEVVQKIVVQTRQIL
jgi:hypothetical protein